MPHQHAPPQLWRSSRRPAIALAALVAGLVPGVLATPAAAAPDPAEVVLMGRVADAAASVRAPLRALARISETRGPSPFAGRPLYRDGSGAGPRAGAALARRAARRRGADRPHRRPATALWLGDWTGDVREAAAARVEAARADGSMPVLVAYNIPDRDCGQHSTGGAGGRPGTARWIDDLAAGLGAGPAAVVLEPDALAGAGLPRARAARGADRLLA